jgi:trk system potassium uptake protein TrkH
MNVRGILNAIGALVAFVGMAMIVPLIVALIYNDGDAEAFALSCGITVGAGVAAFVLTRGGTDLGTRDGFGVVAFGWSAMACFGSLPFLLTGTCTGVTDAVFETMSGFTTTGATILADIESAPHGVLFWRSMIQWIGGMGIIVLSLAILPMLGVGGMQLFRAEAPGPSPDKLTPRIRQTAAYLWVVYVVISGAEVVALMLAGMDLYDAVCHTFTTMATGGFSTRNTSIASFDSAAVDWIIIGFMLLAGSNFALHYRGWRSPRLYFRDQEFRLYALLIVGATLVIGAALWSDAAYDFGTALRSSAFQVVSIMTTTGFATDDYEKWAPAMRWILFTLMLVGGCAGSTAGSMKVVRHLILAKAGLRELAVAANPRVVKAVSLGRGRRVDLETVRNVLGFAVLYMGVLGAGTLALSVFGLDMETALSGAATCLANVGPGLGLLGPTEHFGWLHPMAKWILTFLMLLGRLELYTVLALFLPQTWRR